MILLKSGAQPENLEKSHGIFVRKIEQTTFWTAPVRKLRRSAQLKSYAIRDSSWLLQGIAYRKWLASGRPNPPPHIVKSRNVLAIADVFNLNVLVETGTFMGNMVDATVSRFAQIYSIELYEPLARRAQNRFMGSPNVKIIGGDSAAVLPSLAHQIEEPVLFWLDGHYSGPQTGTGASSTPIVSEIETLAQVRCGRTDAILIDDARLFDGTGGYPRLSEFVETLNRLFESKPYVADDCIFILPTGRNSK